MAMKVIPRLAATCAAMMLLSACQSNNLLMGRVQATVGTHVVVVTDCYRFAVPPPQDVSGGKGDPITYRFMPCKDADVLIRGDELIVGGQSYGHIEPADAITVDHGVVLVNERAARTRPILP